MSDHEPPPWRNHKIPDKGLVDLTLVELLDRGRPVILVGRSSTPSGRKGRELAILDLQQATADLSVCTGIDFSECLPAFDELSSKLKSAPKEPSRSFVSPDEVVAGEEPKRFTNSFVEIDLASSHGVVFLVSTGSASELDEDLEQPFVRRLAKVAGKTNPALIYGKRSDRIGREDWGLGPLMTLVRRIDCFLGEEMAIGQLDEGQSIIAFLKGQGARRQAKQLPRQSRGGQASRSEREMTAGRAEFHLPSPVPPGFGVCWLKGALSSPTERIIYLDEPDSRPNLNEVANGASEVEDLLDPTMFVNQVEVTRWVFKNMHRPGVTKQMIAQELVRRRYSTEQIRRLYGTRASYGDSAVRARTSILKPFLDHLDEYRRCSFTFAVGAGVPPVTISNCRPTDGEPWLLDEDYDRIKAGEAIHRVHRRSRLSFAALRVDFEGDPCLLLTAKEHRDNAGRYSLVLADTYDGNRLVVPRSLRLPADAFADSIAAAIISSGESGAETLQIRTDDVIYNPTVRHLEVHRTDVQQRLDRCNNKRRDLFDSLTAVRPDGTQTMTGAMRESINDGYNALAAKAEGLTAMVDSIKEEIFEARSIPPDWAPADLLLHLLADLRDTRSDRYRSLWMTSLRDVAFATRRESHRNETRIMTWTGYLVLNDQSSGVHIRIPFSGEHRRSNAGQRSLTSDGRAEMIATRLTKGIPWSTYRSKDRAEVRHLVANRLRIDVGNPLLSCEDPTILRASTIALTADVQSAAEACGIPVATVRRILDSHVEHTGSSARWIRPGNRAEVAMHVLASQSGGFVTADRVIGLIGGVLGQVYNVVSERRAEFGNWTTEFKLGYHVTPCECGSIAFAPMQIPEPVGPVCLQCRQDLAGHVWSADPYDQYRCHAELWEAGWARMQRP